MKFAQIAFVVLVIAGMGVAWVITPQIVLRHALHIVALLMLLGIGLATQAVYSRVRRPGKDAEFFGNWRVPGGSWIVIGIVVVVISLLILLATRVPIN